MRGRSLALPFILIALGLLFLVNNAMPGLSVWHLLADWWPVLLIAFGAIRLIEVLALYGTGRAQSGGLRPMGFGWIVGIIVLAFAVPHLSSHFRWDTSTFGWQFANVFGEEFDFPVSVETGAGDAKRVVLDHMRGTVTINGASRSDIQLTGHKTIRASDRNAASKIDDESRVTFEREGDTIFHPLRGARRFSPPPRVDRHGDQHSRRPERGSARPVR